MTLVSSGGHVPETRCYIFIFTIYMAPGDQQTAVSFCFLAMPERVNLISENPIHGILQVDVLLTLNSLWASGPH